MALAARASYRERFSMVRAILFVRKKYIVDIAQRGFELPLRSHTSRAIEVEMVY